MGHGIAKESMLNTKREKERFLQFLSEELEVHEVELYAYCLMGNHFHFLIKSEELQELSSFMAILLAKYAKYYNYKSKRKGHVFQDRFKSECVDTEIYFWTCMRYIHCNPVKANMIKNAVKFGYSSIREYYEDTKNLIHDNAKQTVRDRFPVQRNFFQYHEKEVDQLVMDVKEDSIILKKHIMRNVIEEIAYENHISVEAVREYAPYVKMCIKRAEEQMKISCNESKRIYKMIENE